MNDKLKHSTEELDRDLSPSWIELGSKVRTLASDLKLKAAGTPLAGDADHLSQQTSRLCDHVERIHADVIDLLENLETRIPLRDSNGGSSDPACDDVEKEKIQIQRESHELRSDFKDVIKALFMWRDDPEERVKNKR